jgi:hypothetical protein
MNEHYDYCDLGYGVSLISPCGKTVFLQGDDACQFIDDTISVDELWESEGNPNPSIFDSQEDHIDLVIGPYFD